MNTCKSVRLLVNFNVIKSRNITLASALNAKLKYEQQPFCMKAVNEAEKVVGYPTSFLSLRWLLNDEVANIAMHIRKLIGTNHPLLDTARNLLLRKDLPAWGLIVLLVSKAGGVKSQFSEVECDITAGILHSQRILAEVTEMVRTSNIIHKSLLNIDISAENASDINFGNKLALLSGDYLLSTSFKELAELKSHEVNELVSTTLRDLVEAEFLEPRDKQNKPLPAKPLKIQQNINIPNEFGTKPFKFENVLGNTKAEWTLRHLLGGSSLLAKSCQATLILAKHSREFQKQGYLFGRNMALAWQAFLDREYFETNKTGPFSLISAPVMFHLQHDPSLYQEIIKGIDDVNDIDYNLIKGEVLKGPGLQNTLEMQQEFSEGALNALEHFSESDARSALTNLINAM